MSCYVDKAVGHASSDPVVRRAGARSGHRWCHLIADTLDELHEFAARLGMRRAWFQGEASFPHYDLTASRREAAVKLGAIEVTRRELVAHMRRIRGQQCRCAS